MVTCEIENHGMRTDFKYFSFQTWMYLAVPVSLYVGERVLRALRSRHYSVQIRKVAIRKEQKKHLLNLINFSLLYNTYIIAHLGCDISRQCSITTNVEATSLPVPEWSIHVRSVPCRVTFRMVLIKISFLPNF